MNGKVRSLLTVVKKKLEAKRSSKSNFEQV